MHGRLFQVLASGGLLVDNRGVRGDFNTSGVETAELVDDGWMVGPEPRMRAAIQEEQFALLAATEAPTSMGLVAADFAAMSGRSQQATKGLIGDDDAVIFGQDVGQVGEVVIGVGRGGKAQDLLPQVRRELVVGRPAGIAVADARRAQTADLGLEALHLANRQTQSSGGLGVGDVAVDGRLNDLVLLRLCHG